MQYNRFLNEEKGKLLTLMNEKYIKLDFSKVLSIIDSNINEPLWMDIYILIYKCNLPPDIEAYDILLKKLSTPIVRFYMENDDKRYVATADERLINRFVWYLITGDLTEFYMRVKYIPKKDYVKELLKYSRFFSAGINLINIDEDKFKIYPTDYEFNNVDDATIFYNKFLDAYDIFKSLKLKQYNFIKNINLAIEYGRDKRMIATLSNILSYFNLNFELKDNYITMEGTNFKITNENEADKFQVKLIDAYQFFRNVVNTSEKKDIVSEIYNRRLSPEIRKEFEENVTKYFRVINNQELIDWIITISKESKYTLNITFDDQGVFYIEDSIITSPIDAKEFYIDYMDNKKEKLAMAIYKNNILNRIKNIWNKFRAKFVKI